jgi:hypothetical protein
MLHIQKQADKMVGAERFELPTLWSQTRCATRLRYAPNVLSSYKTYATRASNIFKKKNTLTVKQSVLKIYKVQSCQLHV